MHAHAHAHDHHHDHDHHGHHGHGHGHGHGHHHHDHAAGASARRIGIALGLNLSVLGAELIGAWAFGSLALLSDAAHMFTDAAALAIALAALAIAKRPADDRRTFGYRRFEILAAAFNAVLLFIVGGFVLIEGVRRFFDPVPVASLGMMAVAGLGLVANVIAMAVLAGGRGESMTVRGAYLEVWADALGSLAVIAGAAAIYVHQAAMARSGDRHRYRALGAAADLAPAARHHPDSAGRRAHAVVALRSARGDRGGIGRLRRA